MSSMFKVKSYISIVNIVCHQLLLLLSAVKNVTILLFKEEKKRKAEFSKNQWRSSNNGARKCKECSK